MLDLLGEIEKTLNNRFMIHAIVVHLPVALASLGTLMVLAAAFFDTKRPTLRLAALATYLLLALSAWTAVQTGKRVMDVLPPTLDRHLWDQVEQHEEMAEVAWIFGAVTAGCILLSLIPARAVRLSFTALAIVSSLAAAGWLGVTGHLGGTLVYDHGVGTARMPGFAAPAATAAEGGGDAEADTEADTEADSDPGQAAVVSIPVQPIDMAAAQQISFTKDVWPVLDGYCIECHEGKRAKGKYWMTSVAEVIKGGKKAGPAILPGDPDASPLVQYIRGELRPQMPKGEDPISPEALHTLRLWIAAGANDDSGGASFGSE